MYLAKIKPLALVLLNSNGMDITFPTRHCSIAILQRKYNRHIKILVFITWGFNLCRIQAIHAGICGRGILMLRRCLKTPMVNTAKALSLQRSLEIFMRAQTALQCLRSLQAYEKLCASNFYKVWSAVLLNILPH